MRLLAVCPSGELGGAELALATYLEHLPSTIDARALVLSPGPAVGLLAERLGGRVAVAGLMGRPSARRGGAFGRALLSDLRRDRPDVVLATGVKSAALCVPSCRAAGVPLVWHKLDFSHDETLAAPLSLLCSGVVPISEAVGTAVAARRRLEIVPPPVRLDPGFRVAGARPPATLASIGRLVPYKGHADVIEAAALLRARFPDVRVLIAGGADRSAPGHDAELRAVADRSGLADRVELLGFCERVEPVLERATVVVGATYREGRFGGEGFGAALAEASWAGLPVVATSGGGAGEAVVDGVTGRLVAPRDAAALAKAIEGYLADPGAARQAGERGAALSRERLAPAALTGRLVAILERVSS